MRHFSGKTFVAFADISGFKEMMKQNKAFKVLSHFYNTAFEILGRYRNLSGIFVSDCGIVYCHNESSDIEEMLVELLHAIRDINRQMLSRNYLTTTSIAYDDFSYRDRIELPRVRKNLIY